MGRYAQFRAAVARTAARIRGQEYQKEHYPKEPARGAAPNVGHDTDSYSSDWALFVDYWSRALAVSLGGRLMRGDIAVTQGHKHDDYRTELEFQEVARFRPLGDNQGTGGPAASKGLLCVTSTTPTDCLNCFFHVDDHLTELDLFVRVAQPAPGAPGAPDGWLEVEADIYDLNNSTTVVLRTLSKLSIESKAGGVQFPNYTLGPARLYIGDSVVVRGQRWIQVKLRARVLVAGTIGGIWEVKIGRQRR